MGVSSEVLAGGSLVGGLRGFGGLLKGGCAGWAWLRRGGRGALAAPGARGGACGVSGSGCGYATAPPCPWVRWSPVPA